MPDTARIRANVGRMIDKGASEKEIDTYLASEGATAATLRGAPAAPRNPTPARRLPAPPPKRPMSMLQNISSTAGDFLDGMLPGVGHTMAGVGGAVGNTIAAATGRAKWDPAKAFETESHASDTDKKQFSKDHPNIAEGAGWAGFGASFALPAARVARGAGLRSHIVNGALTGGGYGALSGAMNDTGQGRLSNATNGLLAGGALGGAAAPAMQAGGAVVSSARRNIPGVDAIANAAENGYSRLTGGGPVPRTSGAHAQADRMMADQMDGSRHINQGMGVGNTPQPVRPTTSRQYPQTPPRTSAG